MKPQMHLIVQAVKKLSHCTTAVIRETKYKKAKVAVAVRTLKQKNVNHGQQRSIRFLCRLIRQRHHRQEKSYNLGRLQQQHKLIYNNLLY